MDGVHLEVQTVKGTCRNLRWRTGAQMSRYGEGGSEVRAAAVSRRRAEQQAWKIAHLAWFEAL